LNNFRNRVVPVEQIVEGVGLRIERQRLDNEDLAGFLIRGTGLSEAVVGVNSKQAKTRQRFTLAHELGHFLLHNVEGVHVDQRFTVKLRSGLSSQGTDIDEMEANFFAAELLMPQQWLEEDINNLEAFDLEDNDIVKHLAERYEVSAQAMSIRLSSLGYLSI
jgi:Zn-dependent peptidase ImmA (M78 family)